MSLTIEQNGDRVFKLMCACGASGGEVRFTQRQAAMRTSDDALDLECKAQYGHVCDDCCCKDKICNKHAKKDEHNRIFEPRTSVHPDPKYHHV